MGIYKGQTAGGSGGKRGHRSMEHWGYSEEVKDHARRRRRLESRRLAREHLRVQSVIMGLPIPITLEQIVNFCRKWRIKEFSLFGSVLRDDFRSDSDVDILVAFEPGVRHDIEAWLAMEDELRTMFGREIDLVERRLIDNPFRRHHILNNRRILYAA
jgi:uncharacterized protein